jgi:hypothetical protein
MVVPSGLRDRVPSAPCAGTTGAFERVRSGGVQVAVPIAAEGLRPATAEDLNIGRTTIRVAPAITCARRAR